MQEINFLSLRKSFHFEGAHWGWFLTTVFLVKGQINQWDFLLWSGAIFWSVSMPEPQRSVGIRCHMLFRIEGEWEFLPVVYVLQAENLQSHTCLTDCPKITIFPRIRILNTYIKLFQSSDCAEHQVTIWRPFIPTCWQSGQGIVITEEELINIRDSLLSDSCVQQRVHRGMLISCTVCRCAAEAFHACRDPDTKSY